MDTYEFKGSLSTSKVPTQPELHRKEKMKTFMSQKWKLLWYLLTRSKLNSLQPSNLVNLTHTIYMTPFIIHQFFYFFFFHSFPFLFYSSSSSVPLLPHYLPEAIFYLWQCSCLNLNARVTGVCHHTWLFFSFATVLFYRPGWPCTQYADKNGLPSPPPKCWSYIYASSHLC